MKKIEHAEIVKLLEGNAARESSTPSLPDRIRRRRFRARHLRHAAIYREAIRRMELAELVLKARTVSVSVAGKRQFVAERKAKRANARRKP